MRVKLILQPMRMNKEVLCSNTIRFGLTDVMESMQVCVGLSLMVLSQVGE